eukprot:299677-Rhodomonas_salina.1
MCWALRQGNRIPGANCTKIAIAYIRIRGGILLPCPHTAGWVLATGYQRYEYTLQDTRVMKTYSQRLHASRLGARRSIAERY